MKTSWIVLFAALAIGFVEAQRNLDLSRPVVSLAKRPRPATWQKPPEERRKLSLFPKTNMKFVITPKPAVKDEAKVPGIPTKRPLMRKLIVRDSNDKDSWYFPPREPLMQTKRFTVAADPKLSEQQEPLPKVNVRPSYVPKKMKSLSDLKKERELNKVPLNKGNLISVTKTFSTSSKVVNKVEDNYEKDAELSSNQVLNKNESPSNEDLYDKSVDYETEMTDESYEDEVISSTQVSITESDIVPEVISTLLPIDFEEPLDAISEGRLSNFNEIESTNKIGDISISGKVRDNLRNIGNRKTKMAKPNNIVNKPKLAHIPTDSQDNLIKSRDQKLKNNSEKYVSKVVKKFYERNNLNKLLLTPIVPPISESKVNGFTTEGATDIASNEFENASINNIYPKLSTTSASGSETDFSELSILSPVSEISIGIISEISTEPITSKSNELAENNFATNNSENKLLYNNSIIREIPEHFNDEYNNTLLDNLSDTTVKSNLANENMSMEPLDEHQFPDVIGDTTTDSLVDLTSSILPNNDVIFDQLTTENSNNLPDENTSTESNLAREEISRESIMNESAHLNNEISKPTTDDFNDELSGVVVSQPIDRSNISTDDEVKTVLKGLKDSVTNPFIDESSSVLSNELLSSEFITSNPNKPTNKIDVSDRSDLTGEYISFDLMPNQSGIDDDITIEPSINDSSSILSGELISNELINDKLNTLSGKEMSHGSDLIDEEPSNESLMDQSISGELTSTELSSNGSDNTLDGTPAPYVVTINNSSLDLLENLTVDVVSDDFYVSSENIFNDSDVETSLFDDDVTIKASSHILSGELISDELINDKLNKLNGKEMSHGSDLVDEETSNKSLIDQSIRGELTSTELLSNESDNTLDETPAPYVVTISNSSLDLLENLTVDVVSDDFHVSPENIFNDSNVETLLFDDDVIIKPSVNDSSNILSGELISDELINDKLNKLSGKKMSQGSDFVDEETSNKSLIDQSIRGKLTSTELLSNESDNTLDETPAPYVVTINNSSLDLLENLTLDVVSDDFHVSSENIFNDSDVETSLFDDDVTIKASSNILSGELISDELINDKLNKLSGKEMSHGSDLIDEEPSNESLIDQSISAESTELLSNESDNTLDETPAPYVVTMNNSIIDLLENLTIDVVSDDFHVSSENIFSDSNVDTLLRDDDVTIEPSINDSSSILSGELISDELINVKLDSLSSKEMSHGSDLVEEEASNESLMDQSISGELTSTELSSNESDNALDETPAPYVVTMNNSTIELLENLTVDVVTDDLYVSSENISDNSNVETLTISSQENQSTNLNDENLTETKDDSSRIPNSNQLSDEVTESLNNLTGEEISDITDVASEDVSMESHHAIDYTDMFLGDSRQRKSSEEFSQELMSDETTLYAEEIPDEFPVESQTLSSEKIGGAVIVRFKRGSNIIEEENSATTLSGYRYTGRESQLTHDLRFKNINAR